MEVGGIASSAPIASQFIQRNGNAWLRVAAASMQGRRDNMEDTHRIVLNLRNHDDTAFFGVYDGHGGEDSNAASQYLKAKLHRTLGKLKQFGRGSVDDIRRSVCEFDKQFIKLNENESHGSTATFAIVQKCSEDTKKDVEFINLLEKIHERMESEDPMFEQMLSVCSKHFNTSKDAAMDMMSVMKLNSKEINDMKEIDDKYLLTVGNVGDSRIMLGKSCGKFKMLTRDHKPDDPQEMARISRYGGFVENGRVDNILAISRTIGDVAFKDRNATDSYSQKVIPVPDVTVHNASAGDFLLLCCDGIYEHLNDYQVYKIVSGRLRVSPEPGRVLSHLLDAALNSGSCDNMSAMLVVLEKGQKFADQFIPGPCFSNKSISSWMELYSADARNHGLMDENQLLRLAYSMEFRVCVDGIRKVALARKLDNLSATASIPDVVEMASCKLRFPIDDKYTSVLLKEKRFSLQDLRRLIYIDEKRWSSYGGTLPKTLKTAIEEVVAELAEYELFWRKNTKHHPDRDEPLVKLKTKLWELFSAARLSRGEFCYIWDSLTKDHKIMRLHEFQRLDRKQVDSFKYLPRHVEVVMDFIEHISLPQYRDVFSKYFDLHKLGDFDDFWDHLLLHDLVDEQKLKIISNNGVKKAIEVLKIDSEYVDVVMLGLDEIYKVDARKAREWVFKGDSEFKFDCADSKSESEGHEKKHNLGQIVFATDKDGEYIVGTLDHMFDNRFQIEYINKGMHITDSYERSQVCLLGEDPLDENVTIECLCKIFGHMNKEFEDKHAEKLRSFGVESLKELERWMRKNKSDWLYCNIDSVRSKNVNIKKMIDDFLEDEEKKRAKHKSAKSSEKTRAEKVKRRIKGKRNQLKTEKMQIDNPRDMGKKEKGSGGLIERGIHFVIKQLS